MFLNFVDPKVNFAVSILIVACGISTSVHATVQEPDELILEGKEVTLCDYPLEEFFDTYPERLPEERGLMTSLWRGYVAKFSISDSAMSVIDIQLFLGITENFQTNADNPIEFEWKSIIDDVFPDKEDRKRTWYSGNIGYLETVIPDEVESGRRITHRKELQIKEGVLIQTTKVWTEEHGEDTRFFCTMGA